MGFVSFNGEAEQYLCAAVLRPGNVTATMGARGILRRLINMISYSFPGALSESRGAHQLCAGAEVWTLRERLLKLGARVMGSVRRGGRAPARVVPVPAHLPASSAGTSKPRRDGRLLRSARNIIFEVTQTPVQGSTMPEKLHASQFRHTSDPLDSQHRTFNTSHQHRRRNLAPRSPTLGAIMHKAG